MPAADKNMTGVCRIQNSTSLPTRPPCRRRPVSPACRKCRLLCVPARSFSASRFDAALARASRNLTEAAADERKYPEGLDLQVVLSAAEALKGGILKLTVPSCSPCNQCGGAGREGLFPCALCDGEGLRQETETLRVRVPENVADWQAHQGSFTRARTSQLLSLCPHSRGRLKEMNPRFTTI